MGLDNNKLSEVKKKIEKTKKKLRNIVIEKGYYERFGRKELRNIRDEFEEYCSYTKLSPDEKLAITKEINNFDYWVEKY